MIDILHSDHVAEYFQKNCNTNFWDFIVCNVHIFVPLKEFINITSEEKEMNIQCEDFSQQNAYKFNMQIIATTNITKYPYYIMAAFFGDVFSS